MATALMAAALAPGCGRRDHAGPSHGGGEVRRPTGDAGLATADPASPVTGEVRLPDTTRQLVTAVGPGWDDPHVRLRRWHREPGGAWQADGPAWPGVIGWAGLAWGRGLHGDGAPGGRPGPVKQEGDGRSPAGMFAIGSGYGYQPRPPPGTRAAYVAVDEAWRCVDDPGSRHYNQILDQRTVAPDWRSAETMRRDDPLYQWVIEIGHNRGAAPGGGSCIFFHVWGGADAPTVGCTAMTEPAMAALLAALDPEAAPVLVQLTAADYAALAASWQLPPAD